MYENSQTHVKHAGNRPTGAYAAGLPARIPSVRPAAENSAPCVARSRENHPPIPAGAQRRVKSPEHRAAPSSDTRRGSALYVTRTRLNENSLISERIVNLPAASRYNLSGRRYTPSVERRCPNARPAIAACAFPAGRMPDAVHRYCPIGASRLSVMTMRFTFRVPAPGRC